MTALQNSECVTQIGITLDSRYQTLGTRCLIRICLEHLVYKVDAANKHCSQVLRNVIIEFVEFYTCTQIESIRLVDGNDLPYA